MKIARDADLVETLIHSRILSPGQFNRCLRALIAELREPDVGHARTDTLQSLKRICPTTSSSIIRRFVSLEKEERRKALEIPCKLLPVLRAFVEAGKVDTVLERALLFS